MPGPAPDSVGKPADDRVVVIDDRLRKVFHFYISLFPNYREAGRAMVMALAEVSMGVHVAGVLGPAMVPAVFQAFQELAPVASTDSANIASGSRASRSRSALSPALPTAMTMRPQLASSPAKAVLTRGLSATERP